MTLQVVLKSASAALANATTAVTSKIVAEIILDVLAARPAFNIVDKAIWKYAYHSAIIAQTGVIVALFDAFSTEVLVLEEFAAEVARILLGICLVDYDQESSHGEARESFLAVVLLHCFKLLESDCFLIVDNHTRDSPYIPPKNSCYFLSASLKAKKSEILNNLEGRIIIK